MGKTVKRNPIQKPSFERYVNSSVKEVNYNDIQKFDNIVPAWDYSLIDADNIENAQIAADKFLATKINNINGVSKCNPFTIAKKYGFVLNKLRDKKDNIVYFGPTTKPYQINIPAERDLFIVLFTDKDLNYLKFYYSCKDANLSEDIINNQLIKTYGFYSKRLLFMELQVSKLFKKMNNLNTENFDRER